MQLMTLETESLNFNNSRTHKKDHMNQLRVPPTTPKRIFAYISKRQIQARNARPVLRKVIVLDSHPRPCMVSLPKIWYTKVIVLLRELRQVERFRQVVDGRSFTLQSSLQYNPVLFAWACAYIRPRKVQVCDVGD